jgi:hypothetical protein
VSVRTNSTEAACQKSYEPRGFYQKSLGQRPENRSPLAEVVEWKVDDRAEMPLYGGGRKICGTIKYLDLTIAGKTYKGLVLLGSDSRYYEFVPEIARRITKKY